MTLNEAIRMAQENSTQAKINHYMFLSKYWEFRSYQAQRLPSLNLNAGLGNYNRSIVKVQNYETGEIAYISNNSLTNDISLSVDQNISLTGGKVSIISSLSRLDQFGNNVSTLYNTNPVIINYSQPLGAFNSLKWQKKIAPKEYESAKIQYLESMQDITLQTSTLFFNVLSAQSDYQNAVRKYDDTKILFEIAQKRLEAGDITKSDYLQLELSLLNSDFAVSNYKRILDMNCFEFCIYLGIPHTVELNLFTPAPTSTLDIRFDKVIEYAYENSSFNKEQELDKLLSDREVAQAKGIRGLQADLNANIGLSQSGNSFQTGYRHPQDQEIVGLTLRLPIYDWGLSKGNVKMAEAQHSIVEVNLQQADTRFRQDIFIKVLSFEESERLCAIREKACAIASERYDIVYEKFRSGAVSVTELNISRQEQEEAQKNYITQLKEFWRTYFEIQKITLYDYINERNISADFDQLIEQ